MRNPAQPTARDDFRNRVIERDHDMCVRCGRGRMDGVVLQVHHKQYLAGKEWWEHPLELCETLCSGCHAAEHGKALPKTGWTLIGWDDFGELAEVCEVCGADLRYVYYLSHQETARVIGVGEVCCDNLTGAEGAAELRKLQHRLSAFIHSPRWKSSREGEIIVQKGWQVRIAAEPGGYRIYINAQQGRELYLTLESAQEKVFRVIEDGSLARYVQKQAEHHNPARQKPEIKKRGERRW